MKVRSDIGRPTSLRSVPENSEQIRNDVARQAPTTSTQRSDAVRVNTDQRARDTQINDNAGQRARRVSEIKTQVRDGTYNLDSREVAKAVIRDLLG